MIELDKRVWDEFVCNFAGKLSVGCSIKDALNYFLDDYWAHLDNLAYEACKEEEVKESTEEYATKTYLREKTNTIWEYVYNLNREIGNLKKEVVLLKASNSSNDVYGPIKYPNNIPPTHGYSLDQYMVTAHADTPNYTQEQIDEWSKIRYTEQ